MHRQNGPQDVVNQYRGSNEEIKGSVVSVTVPASIQVPTTPLHNNTKKDAAQQKILQQR